MPLCSESRIIFSVIQMSNMMLMFLEPKIITCNDPVVFNNVFTLNSVLGYVSFSEKHHATKTCRFEIETCIDTSIICVPALAEDV